MVMRSKEQPWEVFDGGVYEDLLLDTQIEYKAERIVAEDEWGTEIQYHVYDVRVTLRHNKHQVGVHLDNLFKYELEETISSYLTRINER